MSEPIKLVLLDLDGTVWDGVLLEDGLTNLRLNNTLVDALRRLDDMGVLLAVVSKNHMSDVAEALDFFRIADLFVDYKASFTAKSIEIYTLLRWIRFSPEVCLFVDDTAFEREEVRHAFPEMGCVSPEEFVDFFNKDDNWAIASSPEEGRLRKQSYRDDKVRRNAETDYNGTFRQFLHQSGLTLKIGRPSSASAARISELTLRTNQINFSSNRYTVADVEALLDSPHFECYIATVADRYGDYGTVGFACLRHEGRQAVIQDLMLSCRVQGKGVETALITVLMEKAKAGGLERMIGLYRPTRRNGQIASVFQLLGFSTAGEEGEYQRYLFDFCREIPARPGHMRVIVSNGFLDNKDVGIPFVRHIVQACIAEKLVQGLILDVGAGWDGVLGEDCDEFIEVHNNKHVRLDMEHYPRTDIVADAQAMSNVEDDSFDAVFCLEVLEHCTNPFALSQEIFRVLRAGGVAIVSAPMNFPIHDTPGDYWRFTPDGLKLLFKNKANLLAEHIEGHNDHPVRTVLVLRK